MVDITIRNCIEACNDGDSHQRGRGEITKAVFHRLSFEASDLAISDEDIDGPKIAELFRDQSRYAAGSYTGGMMPYSLVVRLDGIVDQCAELSDVTPHARAWNHSGIGVAVVGDFRKHYPKPKQRDACVELGARFLGSRVSLHGHTDLEGATADPGKICPGPLFDLDYVRRMSMQRLKSLGFNGNVDRSQRSLFDLGIIF